MLAASLAALAVAPSAAGAQPPASAAASGTVHGVVHDSLGRRPLAGAYVQVVPIGSAGDLLGGRAVVADSTGAFRVDSLAPGRYLVGFTHPLLDLLRVEATPRLAELGPGGDTVRVDLGVPELASVRPVVCGSPQEPTDSAGLLAGRVRDAADGALVPDATVVLTWTEVVFGAGGVRTEPRRVPVTVGRDGRYVVCSVPAGEAIVVSAAAPGRASGEVALTVPPRGFVARDLALGDSAAVTAAAPARGATAPAPVARGTARLTGTVHDSAGRPVRGARASVWGTAAETIVGDDGRFTLGALPAGTHTLEVRAIGYALRQLPVDLAAGRATTVALQLDRAPTLATVTVLGTPSARLSEFLDRLHNDRHGRFVTEDEIVRQNPFEVADALRGVRGVELRQGRGGKRVFARGSFGACMATVILDGMALPIGDPIDRWVGPKQVIGMEFYADGVVVPMKYRMNPPRIDGCGSLLIWTRR